MSERAIKVSKKDLYIEPISSCNLQCRMCYSKVINGGDAKILSEKDILDFVERFYVFFKKKFNIYWCGTGEIFLHKDFPSIINVLNKKYNAKITHDIMTNGTIDRLNEIEDLGNISFFVSIDGLKKFHEWNRGKGTYDKTIAFCKKAVDSGCRKLEVRCLVTKDNVFSLAEFEKELKLKISPFVKMGINIPYAPADFTGTYSQCFSKNFDDSRVLPKKEMLSLIHKIFGSRYNSDIEITKPIILSLCLLPFGVFSCCDGIVKLGCIVTNLKSLANNLANSEEKCKICPLYLKC
ncbi:MAG: radical SAM protein [Candidatus ainarchaeum sp.]|nr:radical SAM protein [Candidatus ainarchaeum sp.]